MLEDHAVDHGALHGADDIIPDGSGHETVAPLHRRDANPRGPDIGSLQDSTAVAFARSRRGPDLERPRGARLLARHLQALARGHARPALRAYRVGSRAETQSLRPSPPGLGTSLRAARHLLQSQLGVGA